MNSPLYMAPMEIGNEEWEPRDYLSVVVLYSGFGNPPESFHLHKIYADEDSPPIMEFDPPFLLCEENAAGLMAALQRIPQLGFYIPPGSWIGILHQTSTEIEASSIEL
jgi:hypothetical protein